MNEKLKKYLSSLSIEEKGADFFRASAVISEGCEVFSGHFPGNPVLPGAFQVQIACLLLSEVLGAGGRLRCVEKAKFRKLLAPCDAVKISAKIEKGGEEEITVACRIEKVGSEASRFTLRLGTGGG